MLVYIEHLISYIMRNWFGSFYSFFLGLNPVILLFIIIPLCLTFLIFSAKLIKKFIWGAK